MTLGVLPLILQSSARVRFKKSHIPGSRFIAVVQKESFVVVGDVFLYDLINLIRHYHQLCLVWWFGSLKFYRSRFPSNSVPHIPNLLEGEQGLLIIV